MKVIKYSADDIASMRAECSAHEYDALRGSGDLSSLTFMFASTLYDGCVGWKHMPDKGVIDYWEANIGSSKDDGPSGEAEEGSEWGSEAVQDAIRAGREDERTGYQRRDGN